MSNKKIGILTWHYYSNFGSALQAYALQKSIASLGYCVEIVNYHDPKFGIIYSPKDTIKSWIKNIVVKLPIPIANNYGRYEFETKYLNCGRIVQNESELSLLTSDYNILVCGSDQIWAPNCYNPIYFATFANKNIRKVSYAASIGLNNIPKELIPIYKKNLSDFFAIGIREDEGKNLLKNCCGIESTVVLDPTLLLNSQNYACIEHKVQSLQEGEKYLFVYILNKNHNYKERIIKFAEKHKLKVIGISSCSEDIYWMHRTFYFSRLGADHFIWLIHHAEAIITDSYHGTIFSLLFHKDFYTFVRFSENDPICQNSRIRQLDAYFNIKDHIIGSNDSLDGKKLIDYDSFEDRLRVLRKQSIDFLKRALR